MSECEKLCKIQLRKNKSTNTVPTQTRTDFVTQKTSTKSMLQKKIKQIFIEIWNYFNIKINIVYRVALILSIQK